MSYFVQQTDENGDVKFVEVADGDLQLPDEELNKRIANSELFRKTVEESKHRKEQIKKLRKQFEELEPAPAGEEPAPEAEQPAKQETAETEPLDEEVLFQRFQERLLREAQAKREAQKSEEEQLAALLEKNGLGEDALDVLRDSKNPEETAKKLAKSAYNFGNTSTGNTKRNNVAEKVGSAFKDLGLD